MAQDDGDEVLRLMILAVLAKADRPLDAEELAERVAAMMGVRLVPERGTERQRRRGHSTLWLGARRRHRPAQP